MDPVAARLDAALENARRFFAGQADVQKALRKLARLLDEEGIAYAIAGAMALNAYGYQRVTVDVDVLLTRAGLDAFGARHLGRGYEFAGSRGLRDAEHGVNIDVLGSAGGVAASPNRGATNHEPGQRGRPASAVEEENGPEVQMSAEDRDAEEEPSHASGFSTRTQSGDRSALPIVPPTWLDERPFFSRP